jgi:glycosyltransferase involved in cell wall biosynthesis
MSAVTGAAVAGPLPLSVFIIARNEARRLPIVLAAIVGLADEIVLVDSGSTDGTQDVARGFGARVVETHWRGYGPQKRYAESLCRNRWALNLDGDEEATPELVAEIRALFAQGEPPLDGYEIAIAHVEPGFSYPGQFAYSLAPVRLYRLDKGRFADALVHDRVEMSPGSRVGALRGRINHYSFASISQVVTKLNEYSDQQVVDMGERGRRISAIRLWYEFPAAFLKAYFLRRHIFRGRFGLVASMNYAFFRFMRIAKALEARDRMERRE